ncbi:hypothetical protein CC2G_006114 [Coprinopsis cinerea AmutBmut pab1-1]|nr:hypothetical protein CC2G_006114 [Coprinopsis cinerea AmutBmut pab1-1]
MAPDQHVLVSYSAPKNLLGSQKWNIFFESMVSQFPLQNVHWRSSFRNQTLRTIPSLNVKFVALDSVRDELASQIPTTVLEKPIIHLFVVHCEDHDSTQYNAFKKEIKEWNETIMQKKSNERVILQIVTPDSAKQSRGGLFAGSVLEKLKAEFNTDKRNRCAQLSYSPAVENRLLWGEFHNIMKECMGYALDQALSVRFEIVKRSEGQQQMPGWNFCTFFLLKESLAMSYEGISVFDEALQQYDDLEKSFLQVIQERNMSWFGNLINPSAGDDSTPLLSPRPSSKKAFRDLILSNEISVFELRIYILSRQCQIMAKMGQVDEVPRKVASFLGTFSKTLKQVQNLLPKFFIQSWVYSASDDAIKQCEIWQEKFPTKNTKRLEAGVGELRDMARTQLDIIGIDLDYLPKRPPFSMSLPGNEYQYPPGHSEGEITNTQLLEALQDKDVFYDLYISHTNEAIVMYSKAGRSRFAVKLHGCLAALDLHRGNLERALDTYSNLASHYAPHTWVAMESYMFSRALDTHKTLNKPQDTEWIHRILSFLKAYVENAGAETLLPCEDNRSYVAEFVNEMKNAASNLENDIRYPDHPALSVQIAKKAILAPDKDGSILDVTIHNDLPCAFPADEIVVTLSGRDFERFQFTTSIETLPPGKSKVSLLCPNPAAGTFFVESSEIRAAKLLLQYPQRKGTPTHQIVRVETDPLALSVRVFQSRKVELGKPFSVSFRIWTGRNSIQTLNLRISAPSTTFHYWEASLDGENDEFAFETNKSGIKLENLGKDTTVRFSIPYLETISSQTMKVEVEVDYVTTEEPQVERTMRFSSNISPSLPISVRVQDWFRDTRLISTFSVKSTTHQYIRVAEANLKVPDGVDNIKVVPCNIRKGTITVTPNENANFLFALDSMTGPVSEQLFFHIKYRLLREEVGSIVEEEVRAALDEASKSQDLRPLIVDTLIELLENDPSWVSLYNITGEIELPDPSNKAGEVGEMIPLALERLRRHRHPQTPQGIWRELRLPVDVPVKDIVATASINILSTPFSAKQGPGAPLSLYAGQPINAELVIRTTLRWGSDDESARRHVLNYHIEDMTREWLIGGIKQGDFIAENNGKFTLPLTLMALHHGEFGLPKVHVQPRVNWRDITVASQAPPNVETYQEHGAVKVLVLPRGGRSTFVVAMGSADST